MVEAIFFKQIYLKIERTKLKIKKLFNNFNLNLKDFKICLISICSQIKHIMNILNPFKFKFKL